MTGTCEVSRRTRMITDGELTIAPILIQVPALRSVPNRSVAAVARKPRRRLRREVRYSGGVLLLVGTLAIGFLAGSHSSNDDSSETPREAYSSPSITLSIEPIAAVASRPMPERREFVSPPVELESTLLPEDGTEDQAHEGN
jgi:hypothetical protein